MWELPAALPCTPARGSPGLGHPIFAGDYGLRSAGSGLINPEEQRQGRGHLREEGGPFGDPCTGC